MKKLITLILVLAFALTVVGGSSVTAEGAALLKSGEVGKVTVTSQPEYYNYSFSGDDAKAIVDYISGLHLIADFSENPDVYGGMTWVISIEYEDGDVLTVYHFGNFIRTAGGSWYKMTYEEASRFDVLLNELNN